MLYSTLVSNFPITDLKKKKNKNSYVALLYIIAFKSMKHSFPLPVCFEDIFQDQQLKLKKVMLQHLQTLISVEKLWAVTLK